MTGEVGVPRQLVIEKDSSSIPDAVGKAELRLPIGTFFLFTFVFNQLILGQLTL